MYYNYYNDRVALSPHVNLFYRPGELTLFS